jgi:hypothetical protein
MIGVDVRNKEDFYRAMDRQIQITKFLNSGGKKSPGDPIPFCPFTTPDAVDYLMRSAEHTYEQGRKTGRDWGEYPGMGDDPEWPDVVRLELVRRYLFSPVTEPLVLFHMSPFTTPETVPRWKGEILRYGADLNGQHPSQVTPTRELVSSYCERNKIPGLHDEILEAFGL